MEKFLKFFLVFFFFLSNNTLQENQLTNGQKQEHPIQLSSAMLSAICMLYLCYRHVRYVNLAKIVGWLGEISIKLS